MHSVPQGQGVLREQLWASRAWRHRQTHSHGAPLCCFPPGSCGALEGRVLPHAWWSFTSIVSSPRPHSLLACPQPWGAHSHPNSLGLHSSLTDSQRQIGHSLRTFYREEAVDGPRSSNLSLFIFKQMTTPPGLTHAGVRTLVSASVGLSVCCTSGLPVKSHTCNCIAGLPSLLREMTVSLELSKTVQVFCMQTLLSAPGLPWEGF